MDELQEHNIAVDFIFSPVINYSLYHNLVPVIRKLQIHNLSDKDLINLIVSLSFEPEFGVPLNLEIAMLQAGELYQVKNFDLKLSAKYLSELTERVSGMITMVIKNEDHLLYQNHYNIDVLAFDQWQGISNVPEIISTFITPNNPYISKIIARASEILNRWTGSPSLDEYQSRNPDRVKNR